MAGPSCGACLPWVPCAWAQQAASCGDLMHFKAPGVEISKAAPIAAGTTEPNQWGPGHSAPLPAYCRVEGVINRRTGVGGEEFGINFALAMPEKWNGDFLMQGGGGGNGTVQPPLGLNAAGETPALMRGFAVVSTDTGHKSHRGPFDFDFMKDQQAYLDFAYLANAEVATLAQQLIAQHYGKPAAYSYFSGCSTGGREGMILSQRYPTLFNGIISGDPAMRTGLSNLAIGQWIPVTFNQIAPKDAAGKPIIQQAISDADRKLIMDALLKKCDALDGSTASRSTAPSPTSNGTRSRPKKAATSISCSRKSGNSRALFATPRSAACRLIRARCTWVKWRFPTKNWRRHRASTSPPAAPAGTRPWPASTYERLARLPVDVDYASEYRYRNPIPDRNALGLLITQSGETADTLAAQREMIALGSKTVAICNVVGAMVAREAHGAIYPHADPRSAWRRPRPSLPS